MTRAELIATRIDDRLAAICEAVPPIDPPPMHWLDSDAGPSYCFSCAVVARGREFELGPPLRISAWYERDDIERAFYGGIDGGFDTHEDSAAACEICGCTLSHILTDYGVEEEIRYYREAPLATVRGEDSYALDRLCLNIYSGSPREHLLGAAVAVGQAYRIIKRLAA